MKRLAGPAAAAPGIIALAPEIIALAPGIIALALGIIALFLHPADQYFFGDSISALTSRPLSWTAFFHDFIRLDGYHWFRPLDGLLPMVLFPHWGMDFALYHRFAILQHFVLVLIVFFGVRALTGNGVAAWIGSAFYAVHPIQFYATYDICFYQEPVGIGLILIALAFLYRGKLVPGLLCFVLALSAREVAVVTPGLLGILLLPRLRESPKRVIATVGLAGVISAIFTYLFLFVMHPLRYQPGGYTSDWHVANVAHNLLMEARWAFGIAVGPETAGWRSPLAVQGLLAACALGAIAVTLLHGKRVPALWQGPAWFFVASLPTLSTHRMLPHHLYLPLIGIALWIAGVFTVLGARSAAQPRGAAQVLRSAAAAVLLASICATTAISVRYDSLNSWVGLNARETKLAEAYSHSALRDMAQWQGVWIVVKDGDPSFSWLYGRVFRLMVPLADEDRFETQLLTTAPATAPKGIHVFEFSQSVLRPLEIPQSTVAAVASASVSVTPLEVHPGTSYTIRVPELAGRAIDLRYRYNDHLSLVAYGFTTLNADGSANVFTGRDIPWGVVEITGVRPVGAMDWAAASVRVEVLRD